MVHYISTKNNNTEHKKEHFWVPGGAGELITMSTGAFCKMYTCTNTPEYSLLDVQNIAEIDLGILELCRFYELEILSGGESIYLSEFWAALGDMHMY